ncbi:hypothetical protein NM208_g4407 [Fusarium decemcellulare]|uniref:Uncharacterized protein n=1 Tax=Fusarium decemcellulare TaxID=57161 RepID=A0ACC1SKZ4_9HYPO|nr:hypothetical protein NM208_g4407 [Fusarium decemcellulare]
MSNQPTESTSPPQAAPVSSSPRDQLVPANDSDSDASNGGDSSMGQDASFESNYFLPNDDPLLESLDLTHHYLTILLDEELFLAPIKEENLQRVLDVGTGTGIACLLTDVSEFADRYPSAEVIGTDLSPCQPQWIPPNARFEIDDATLRWTWDPNSFNFIHIRYLFGAIQDWGGLFKEAFRCCAPGGWVQSTEANVEFRSDDGTVDLEPSLQMFTKLFQEGGKALGRPFFVHDLQEQGFKEAGFEDVQVIDHKLPVGGWPKDPKLAQVGQFVRAALENDLEGLTLMMWHDLLQWPKEDYQLFLMGLRKGLHNPKVHSYMTVRYIYGRKPA